MKKEFVVSSYDGQDALKFLLKNSDRVRFRGGRVSFSFANLIRRSNSYNRDVNFQEFLKKYSNEFVKSVDLNYHAGEHKVKVKFTHYIFMLTPRFKELLLTVLPKDGLYLLECPVFYSKWQMIGSLDERKSLYVFNLDERQKRWLKGTSIIVT